MLEMFHEITITSIIIRLVLAILIGGAIGLQRNITNHPAGFRTYILVCLGSTMAMLTNQYMCDVLGYEGDVGRLGAQVITGVGFGSRNYTGYCETKGKRSYYCCGALGICMLRSCRWYWFL